MSFLETGDPVSERNGNLEALVKEMEISELERRRQSGEGER